ncbi:MAG: amino acid permease [Cellvibrionaceae bacterium]|jgi:amino acid permease
MGLPLERLKRIRLNYPWLSVLLVVFSIFCLFIVANPSLIPAYTLLDVFFNTYNQAGILIHYFMGYRSILSSKKTP